MSRPNWQRGEAMVLFTELFNDACDQRLDQMLANDNSLIARTLEKYQVPTKYTTQAISYELADKLFNDADSNLELAKAYNSRLTPG